jgi:hypothetical protein
VTRLALSFATYLSVLLLPDPTRACPVVEPDALVDSGLSSIRTPIQVNYYGGGQDGGFCHARLALELSTLPSRNLVPRPRELAGELVPVAKAFGAKTCEIMVWVNDDLHPDVDALDDAESCRRAEFRYDGGSWWAIGDEQPCWEEE